jgi:heme/copper-type cytochrome/quinol oxidase subunit 4
MAKEPQEDDGTWEQVLVALAVLVILIVILTALLWLTGTPFWPR